MKIRKTDSEKHVLELFETYGFAESQIKEIQDNYPALSNNELYQDELNNSDTKMFQCFMGEMATAQFTLETYESIVNETDEIMRKLKTKYGDQACELVKEAFMEKSPQNEIAKKHKCSESTIKRKLKQYISEVIK